MIRLLLAALKFRRLRDAADVLDLYERLHRDKLGMHWLFAAAWRIANGEDEDEVMGDYGWQANRRTGW